MEKFGLQIRPLPFLRTISNTTAEYEQEGEQIISFAPISELFTHSWLFRRRGKSSTHIQLLGPWAGCLFMQIPWEDSISALLFALARGHHQHRRHRGAECKSKQFLQLYLLKRNSKAVLQINGGCCVRSPWMCAVAPTCAGKKREEEAGVNSFKWNLQEVIRCDKNKSHAASLRYQHHRLFWKMKLPAVVCLRRSGEREHLLQQWHSQKINYLPFESRPYFFLLRSDVLRHSLIH